MMFTIAVASSEIARHRSVVMGNGFRLKLVLSRGLDLSEQEDIAGALNNYPECLTRRVSDDCPHYFPKLVAPAGIPVRRINAEQICVETAVYMWFPTMEAACESASRVRKKIGKMNAGQTDCNSS